MKSLKSFALTLPLLIAASACDAQVGEDYGGEIILHLQGSVDLLDDSQEKLEPALYFRTNGGRALVRGQVEGVFPSDFELRLSKPPPKESLRNGVARGYLVLASADEADWAPVAEYDGLGFNCLDFSAEEGCSFENESCVEDGRCLTRQYECEALEMEVVKDNGSTLGGAAEAVDGPLIYESNCWEAGCLSAGHECSDDDECHTVFYQSDPPKDINAVFEFADQTQFECYVAEISGDEKLIETSRFSPTASNYVVIYIDDKATLQRLSDSMFHEAVLGYNLYKKRIETMEEMIEYYECRFEVELEARDEYNKEHGTDYSAHGPRPQNVASAMTKLEDDERCSSVALKRVKNPAEVALNIEIGSVPDLDKLSR